MAKKPSQNQTETPEKKNAVAAVRKITVASVYGKIKVSDIPKDEELKICRIAGVASGIESGESNYGPWTMLLGEFAATNHETGEVFAGVKSIVPGAMGEQLILSMNNALLDDAGSKLKFCVDISAKVSPRDPNKYEYIVRPVMAPDVKNEALSLLTFEG